MMNAIEKLHAILVSDEVNVWHFPTKKETPRFFYWVKGETNPDGHGCETLEGMIDEAYAKIDPLLKILPSVCPKPEGA